MPVFNMPRPGRAGLTNRGGFAQEQAKPNYNTRPSQPVQPELGMRKKPSFSGAKPGFAGTMPTRPPQSVQPIGSGFSGQMKPPVYDTGRPGGPSLSAQQIQPLQGGFAGNADFGQRQYAMDLASLGQRFNSAFAGSGVGPQFNANMSNVAPTYSTPNPAEQLLGTTGAQAPSHLPWWYRNNRQQPQQLGSLGAALNQFYSGDSNAVMNPTFHML